MVTVVNRRKSKKGSKNVRNPRKGAKSMKKRSSKRNVGGAWPFKSTKTAATATDTTKKVRQTTFPTVPPFFIVPEGVLIPDKYNQPTYESVLKYINENNLNVLSKYSINTTNGAISSDLLIAYYEKIREWDPYGQTDEGYAAWRAELGPNSV